MAISETKSLVGKNEAWFCMANHILKTRGSGSVAPQEMYILRLYVAEVRNELVGSDHEKFIGGCLYEKNIPILYQ